MRPLGATYRLQFREGMDFAKAASLAPYLAGLGISHLYASPILRAVPGSTHGYDTASYDRIECDLGGVHGFRAMVAALHAEKMGVILDFVPNHMGASPANPWWRDVLEWGAQSPYAHYFDIDWSAPKLLIPALGEPYGAALDRGAFGLHFDGEDGGISLATGGLKLPLSPPSYATILAKAEDTFADLTNRFAVATPETSAELKTELAQRAGEPGRKQALQRAIDDVARDRDAIHALHEAQAWRLAYWRAARETLTYRRFFEVADLVGVRMEQPSVFEDAHRLMVQLIEDGAIDGLRLDHVDGLTDPLSYVRKLRDATSGKEIVLLVEKILGPAEALRADWPIEGTTGYEFIRSLGGLLTDPSGEAALTAAYRDFIGETVDYAAQLSATKRHIFVRNLAGELDVLTGLASGLAQADLCTRDFGRDTLRRAIIEMATSLPVYRTYVDVEGPRPEDEALIAEAETKAKSTREVEDDAAIDFIARIWRLQLDDPAQRPEALTFVTRFQQTTGPLMAKAVEDTLFFRYNRLIALNEVGGAPEAFGSPVQRFHDDMAARRTHQPLGLLATSTHDTKRGEDARARLYAISEYPGSWRKCVTRWHEMNAGLRFSLENAPAPGPNEEWMFYQALAGAWPFQIDIADAVALTALADRMAAFMQKATREAKLWTSWTAPDEPYEQAVEAFVRGVLNPSKSKSFLEDFSREQAELQVAGALNSLTQTLLKLTAPGVPDIYQGAECWDLSLVDPDNRRPVDFDARRRALDDAAAADSRTLLADWQSGAIKLAVVKAALAARQSNPALFTGGVYTPLAVHGGEAERVVAFLREDGEDAAIIIAPLRARALLGDSVVPLVPPDAWDDTTVAVPPGLKDRTWRNAVTSEVIAPASALRLAYVLSTFPVALLIAD